MSVLSHSHCAKQCIGVAAVTIFQLKAKPETFDISLCYRLMQGLHLIWVDAWLINVVRQLHSRTQRMERRTLPCDTFWKVLIAFIGAAPCFRQTVFGCALGIEHQAGKCVLL